MKDLNFHWLYYFWMTAREGSMTAAAKKLGVTQPTVSALVQELEAALGQSLFERTGRSLRLSESGALAFRYADDIFSLGKEMCSALHGNTPLARHPFRIGISDVVPKILAQRIIDPVYDLDPLVPLHCLSDSADHLLAKLAVHEIDLVISDTPISPALKIKAFHHPALTCASTLVANSQLKKKIKKDFPESLKDTPLLLPAAASLYRQNIDFWLQRSNVAPTVRAEFEDTGLMKVAGAHAHGAFIVPSVISQEVCKDYQVEKVADLPDLTYTVYLISLERKIKHPVVSSIMKNMEIPEKKLVNSVQ